MDFREGGLRNRNANIARRPLLFFSKLFTRECSQSEFQVINVFPCCEECDNLFLEGNLAGILQDCFRPTKQRLKNIGDSFGTFFVGKFVPRKNLSCQLHSADVPR